MKSVGSARAAWRLSELWIHLHEGRRMNWNAKGRKRWNLFRTTSAYLQRHAQRRGR